MRHVKKKANITVKNVVGSVSYGVLLSVMISLMVTLLLALNLRNGVIEENFLKTAIFVVQMISVFGGCIFSLSVLQDKKTFVAALVLVGYMTVVFLVGVMAYKGAFESVGLAFISSFIGAVIALGVKLIHVPRKNYAKKYIR